MHMPLLSSFLRPVRKAIQSVALLLMATFGLSAASLHASIQPTTTKLSVSDNSVNTGTPVRLTATVASNGAPVIHGEVEFCYFSAGRCEDTTLIGTAELTANGTASIKLILPPGRHDIYAWFLGTTTCSSSSSMPDMETIDVHGRLYSTADISISGSAGSYALTSNVGGFGTEPPAGRVQFLDAASKKAIASAHLSDAATFGQTEELLSTSNVVSQGGPAFSAFYVAGDFDGDGVPDVAAAYPPFTTDSLGNLVTPYNPVIIFKGDPQHPGHFLQGATFVADASNNPPGFITSMAAADFNGDGILDLAICFEYPASFQSGIGILLGDAAHPGHFLPIQEYYESQGYLNNLVVADFNKDGLPDLAYMSAGYLAIRFNSPANPGQFPQATPYPLNGALPDSFVAGDFNGDGFPDIAMSITTQGSGHVGLAL